MRYDWKIIWMLRDGRDVIVSKNENNIYHCPVERWVKVHEEFFSYYFRENVLIIRYEELVNFPNNIMNDVGNFIEQKYQSDFHNFYQNININNKMNIGIKPRKIDTKSIGNWKNPAHKKVINSAMENSKFTKLLTLFGYE
jgi:hypothetical protein